MVMQDDVPVTVSLSMRASSSRVPVVGIATVCEDCACTVRVWIVGGLGVGDAAGEAVGLADGVGVAVGEAVGDGLTTGTTDC
jgi:hypothetical protein